MISGKYKTDPFTLERVPEPRRIARLLLIAGGLGLFFVLGWLGPDYLSTSPQERILVAENRALQGELSESHARVARLMEQMEDLAKTDRELYRLILNTDDIPSDVRQVGVGGIDPYSHFDAFSKSTAELLRGHAEILDELERKIALQNASYEYLRDLGVEAKEKLAQLPSILPVQGHISSGYGIRLHPILGYQRMHSGVDIFVSMNSPVYATGGGVVERVAYSGGYGRYIVISHPKAGYKTLYAHLNSALPHIRKGVPVVRGEQIAHSGNTGLSLGPHVHYEVQNRNNRALNPIHFFEPSLTPHEYQDFLAQVGDPNTSLD